MTVDLLADGLTLLSALSYKEQTLAEWQSVELEPNIEINRNSSGRNDEWIMNGFLVYAESFYIHCAISFLSIYISL